MSWLIRVYSGGFSKIVSLSDETRDAIDKFKQKLSHFLYETYTKFRIEQLFDIIIGILLSIKCEIYELRMFIFIFVLFVVVLFMFRIS